MSKLTVKGPGLERELEVVSKSRWSRELSTARGRQVKTFPKQCQRSACPKVYDDWQLTAVLQLL